LSCVFLATLGTQDTGQINVREYRRDNEKGQSRETGNIGYTRHRANTCTNIQPDQFSCSGHHGLFSWARMLQ
jgi:hypothetical protein